MMNKMNLMWIYMCINYGLSAQFQVHVFMFVIILYFASERSTKYTIASMFFIMEFYADENQYFVYENFITKHYIFI